MEGCFGGEVEDWCGLSGVSIVAGECRLQKGGLQIRFSQQVGIIIPQEYACCDM